jgi:hypothetical protein
MKETTKKQLLSIASEMMIIADSLDDEYNYEHYLASDAQMDMRSLHDKIVKVLDEDKVRNCDVGTIDEQCERHENYCGNGSGNISCINSTASNCRKCYAKWLQMDYQ